LSCYTDGVLVRYNPNDVVVRMNIGDVVVVEDRSPKIETSTMMRAVFSPFDL